MSTSHGQDIELDRIPTQAQESASYFDNGASSDEDAPSAVSTPLSTAIRKVTLVTAFLAVLQLSLLAIFVAYVWSRRAVQHSGVMWVAISNNLLLLMSTTISRVPPVVVPFAMSIAAYGFAKEWLVLSTLPDNQGSPTPEQYQVALQVNGSADLGAVWATMKYLYRRSSGPRHPNWLTKSIAGLFTLISLAYSIGGVDIWLHQAVFAGRLTSFTTSSTSQTNFSRILNHSLCPLPDGAKDIRSHTVCTFDPHDTPASFLYEALATITNKSLQHEVALLPNTTISLLLPAYSIRKRQVYEASTFATYSTCAPMSRECNLRQSVDLESQYRFRYQCIGRPTLSGEFAVGQFTDSAAQNSYIIGVFEGGRGRVTSPCAKSHPWNQPLELGIIASFPNNLSRNEQDLQLVQNFAGVYGVLLWCEMTILNVTYRHHPYRNNSKPVIQILNYTLANPWDALVISRPISTGFGASIIYHSSLSSVLDDLHTWTNAYAGQLSRVALALPAGVIIPAKTLVDYPVNPTVPVSRVPFLPAIAFVVVNALFSVCLLVICLGMDTKGPVLRDWKGADVNAVKLTHMRLTNPAALIYEMFCTDAGHKKSGCDEADRLLALDESEEVRIRVGVLEKSTQQDETGLYRFGMATEGPTQPLDEVHGTTIL